MKSLLDVTISLLLDCGRECGANPTADIKYVRRRTAHEGESFLTITLPLFSEALESGLRDGEWPSSQLTNFTVRGSMRLPLFLGGFTGSVFSPDGKLLPEPSVAAIRAIRQVCRVHSRLFTVCSEKRKRDSEKRFLEVENEVRSCVYDKKMFETFCVVSDIVWSNLVGGRSDELPYDLYRPRHGPGTTCEGRRGNDKYRFPSWPQRLERRFPFSEFGCASIRNPEVVDVIQDLSMPTPRDELPVRVISVPKTAKKTRVIAIEPVAMQFMQQALSDWLRPRIETLGEYTSGRVNFSRQDVNTNLARIGSLNGKLATIDLSDASDRVSCRLVSKMLRVCPDFRADVFACRSTRAGLPDGTIVPLSKFASMGSALCFPVEAVVFFIAIVSARIVERKLRPTASHVYNYSRDVYVYGDDLIVPADEAPTIVDGLESLGLKVNARKSFWTGKFRESCGKDYYDGQDVTPVYVRREVPGDRADVAGLVSWVATANQFYWIGCWSTARSFRNHIEKILGVLPSVLTTTQALGWNSFSNAVSFHGWHSEYQRLKLRALVPACPQRYDPLEGDAALLKCFRTIGSEELPAPEHLTTSVRYGNLVLKRRWL